MRLLNIKDIKNINELFEYSTYDTCVKVVEKESGKCFYVLNCAHYDKVVAMSQVLKVLKYLKECERAGSNPAEKPSLSMNKNSKSAKKRAKRNPS